MTENGARPHTSPADGDFEPETPEVAAERAVLGAVIQSRAAAVEVLAVLRPQHFSKGAHRTVFEAVERLVDAGNPVEPASVLGEIARAGMLSRTGAAGLGSGGVFLANLMERAGFAGYHAARVLDAWKRDNLTVALESGLQVLRQPGFDPDVHLDQVRKLVEDATAFTGTQGLRTQPEVVNEVMAALEEDIEPGLSTGFPDLDEVTGGLQPGKFIVIGARPGVGKSVLCLNIADHVAGRLGLPVLFCSLEMREEELEHRRFASLAKVPLHALAGHRLGEAEWDRLQRAHERLTASALRIDDTPGASLAHVRGRLRQMAREGNPARLVIIDYLGLLAEPKSESRQAAVAALARGCKLLAREQGIPVIAAAQLNRGPESRQDKVPVLADLRESGEIEAAADVVILLHREDAYERESPRAGETDLLLRKNRQGPQCTITVQFQGHYARMVSMAPAPPGDPEWSPTGKRETS